MKKDVDITKEMLLKFFSAGFKNFLDRKKISTRELANFLKITDSSISSWKYGRAFPDVPNLIKLFVLGLSPFEIMDRTLEMFARIGDKEYLLNRNEKEMEFLKNSSISDEISSSYLAQLEEENFNLKQEIENFRKR